VSLVRHVRLGELARGPAILSLAPDDAQRAALAKTLGLEGLPALAGEVRIAPWLDGAELTGSFQGIVTQVCGVSLETFDQPLNGEFEVRVLPADSPNQPQDDGGELTLDLEAPDPPDLLEGEEIDVEAYVVEHLALAIDPFPRKPGVEFEYMDKDAAEVSPFAVLKNLQARKGD
jgi:uncharacterized metal-binding protein YceD (DUF177 family)